MSGLAQYPSVGCIVEYFEANAPQIAVVIEENGDKLRILLPNRREAKLPAARVLPWIGPVISNYSSLSRDAVIKALEASKKKREEQAREIPIDELWEMANGEVSIAPARWFAELFSSELSADIVASYAHALLLAKNRFRFVPPNFEVFSAEQAEKKDIELAKQRERERLLGEGCTFVRTLWDIVNRKRSLEGLSRNDFPSEETAAKLESLFRSRMADPESQEEDANWKLLVKGLGEIPELPLQLLTAWGKIPPHYNAWFDRANYHADDTWWHPYKDEVESFVEQSRRLDLPRSEIPFVSIDGNTTKDVDDAFFLKENEDGSIQLTLALSCPGLGWPLGSKLDKHVLHRATSIYLPEQDCHMMPEFIGTDVCSLLEGVYRPALLLSQRIEQDGSLQEKCEISLAAVRLEANLRYPDCQAVIEGQAEEGSRALAYKEQLELGLRFLKARMEYRISQGAIILGRPDPGFSLSGEGENLVVSLCPDSERKEAQQIVAEMMILGSARAADWAVEHEVPVFFRTQDVPLPKDYAGLWTDPVDIARIMHAMVPSIFSTQARPHAALGLVRYAPITSPLRRYADLINEIQIISFLQEGKPAFSLEGLEQLILILRPSLEASMMIQRMRPRYWKLLYFRQQGDKAWWHGVVTEETELFVAVYLKEQDLFVRGRRRLFDEKICIGMPIAVRLGKVNPLYNDISIVEALPDETLNEEDFLIVEES